MVRVRVRRPAIVGCRIWKQIVAFENLYIYIRGCAKWAPRLLSSIASGSPSAACWEDPKPCRPSGSADKGKGRSHCRPAALPCCRVKLKRGPSDVSTERRKERKENITSLLRCACVPVRLRAGKAALSMAEVRILFNRPAKAHNMI